MADAAFAQRRKTLRNSLRSALQLDADSLDRALLRSGIDGTVRAETLPPETFLALARELEG